MQIQRNTVSVSHCVARDACCLMVLHDDLS